MSFRRNISSRSLPVPKGTGANSGRISSSCSCRRPICDEAHGLVKFHLILPQTQFVHDQGRFFDLALDGFGILLASVEHAANVAELFV